MKITKYFLSLAAAVGMIAGCQKPEMVEIAAPENVVAPVLEAVDNIQITKENLSDGSVTIKWSAADFGAPAQINYALEVAAAGSDSKHVLTSGITTTETVVSYQTLNTFLLSDLGFTANVPGDVDFYVSAKVGEYAKVYSAAVKAAVTPMEAVVPEADLYGKVWVIGDYCGWDHGKTQFLFDYAKNETVYNGVIDFGEKAANGWKITGVAGWDDTCNWGLDGDAAEPAAEASPITLISSGGSKDIKIYSKRFYNFEFDKSSLTLTVKKGFDALGVIGDFNGWGADVEMQYNVKLVRFYADVEIPADGGFKVRVAGSWDNGDWGGNGGDATAGPIPTGGDNVAVKAGNYRIYLDLNKGTIEANAKMYGQPEPGVSTGDEPEPVPVTWVVNGNFNNWGGEPVISMTDKGNDVWEARNVKFAAIDEFKLTSSEGAWVGGPEENADSQIDPANPYKVFKPTLGEPFATGDKNIAVGAEGEYNILFDKANGTITVTAAVTGNFGIHVIDETGWDAIAVYTWGDVNDGMGGWPGTLLTETKEVGGVTYLYAAIPSELLGTTANLIFNNNNNGVQHSDYRVVLDHDIFVKVTAEGVENIGAAEPEPEKPAVPETMYMTSAEFGNWFGNADEVVSLVPVNGKPGQFWTIRYLLASGDGYKFNSSIGWDGNEFAGLDTNDGYTVDGNAKVAEDGIYMIHVDVERSMVHFEPARVYGIGPCFNNAWDEGMEAALFTADGQTLKVTLATSGEIRLYAASSIANSDWWTREFIFFDGQIAYRGNGGDQERVQGSAGQTITLDFNAGTAVLSGEAAPEPEPEVKAWHMVGGFNGWKAEDANYKMTKEGDFYVFKGFVLESEQAMKFAVGNWADERGGTGSFTANAAMPLLNKDGGKDIKVPAGTYDVYLDDVNNKGYFMTDGKTPADAIEVGVEPYDLSKIVCGLAGSFNGEAHWDNPPTGERLATYVSAEGNVATYKLANFALKTGDMMKLILDGAWCGGTVNADYSIDIQYNAGGDIAVPEGIDGNYDIYISFKYELVDSKHTFSEIKIQIAPAA